MREPKKGVTFNCDVCGKECYLSQKQYNEQNQHCCSLKCRNELRGKDYLPGKKFGRLTVIKRLGTNCSGCREILCECECGKVTTVTSGNRGKIKSCGCLGGKKKHGMRGSPEMRCWEAMIGRCNNKNNKDYQEYGERGVKVKFKDFEEFYKEIGPRPGKEYSVDRIDNNKGYEPGNVRWATIKEQANNRRSNTVCVINGEKHNLKERANKMGITYQALKYRIKKGIIKGEIYPYKPYKDVI